MKCAVIGHAEWVEFARVPAMPGAGEIVHADEVWEEPGGGGPVVASQLAKLAGGCDFFTALGDDELGHAAKSYLQGLDMDIHVQWRGLSSTRRAWVHVGPDGERTITVLGDKLLPDAPPGIEGFDLVFFVSGTVEAVRAARGATFLAATVRELPTLEAAGVPVAALRATRGATFLAATLRELPTLQAAGVPLDLLVGSVSDPGERYEGSLEARTVVLTDGAAGGTANGERYAATEPPGSIVDTYGAGDSFGAALALALARGEDLPAALELAARAGASVLAGRGPYTTQLSL
jgi:ribokinase